MRTIVFGLFGMVNYIDEGRLYYQISALMTQSRRFLITDWIRKKSE